MTWDKGNQPQNLQKEDINKLLLEKGFIEENKPHPNQKVVQFDEMGNLI